MNTTAWNYASDTISRLLLDASTSPEDRRYAASFLPEMADTLSKLTFRNGAHSHPAEISTVLDFMTQSRESSITAEELIKFSSTESISLPVLSIGIGIALMDEHQNNKRAMFFLTQHGRINGFSDLSEILARKDPWIILPEYPESPEHLIIEPADQRKDKVSGRTLGVRRHKKTTFIDVSTQPENQQIALDNQTFPQGDKISSGDYVSVAGSFGITRSLTRVLFVESISSHTKPGVLTVGKMAQDWQKAKEEGQVLLLLRQGLTSLGFLEVQTATLSNGYEGGSSRPFISFENSGGVTKYLRVTSELELLKLIAGGAQKVFEMGRSYRNEKHVGEGTKEFTMLEAYSAVDSLDDFSEQFCTSVLSKAFGRAITFRKKGFAEIARETIGMTDISEPCMRAYAAAEIPEISADNYTAEELTKTVYNRKIVPLIQEPTILTALPMNGSPLIKGEWVEASRYWVLIHGMELAEISENETDYANLRRKFNKQFSAEEGLIYRDYTGFLNAMAQGMPRTVGVGLGCKRLLEAVRIDRENRRSETDLAGPG